MKSLLALAILGMLTFSASAQEKIRLKSLEVRGKLYENVTVWKISDSQAGFSHKSKMTMGSSTVGMSALPPVVQAKLGYNPEAAQESRAAKAAEAAVVKAALASAPTVTSAALAVRKTAMESGGGGELELSIRNATDLAGVVYMEILCLSKGQDSAGTVVGVESMIRKRVMVGSRATDVQKIDASRCKNGWVIRLVDPDSSKVIAVQASATQLVKWSEPAPVGSKGAFK